MRIGATRGQQAVFSGGKRQESGNEIGQATAKKMKTARLVFWAQYGIYGAGKDLDETFGLIETPEKATEIYLKIAHLPLGNTISDQTMHQLEARFGVKAREGYLR